MPLAYIVDQPLTIPTDQFNEDGIAVLLASGARYGGSWVINAVGNGQQVLGSIETNPDERPSMAVDTAFVWFNDTCVKAGLKIIHFQNLNERFPEDQRPFFSLAQFAVVDKDWQ